MKDHIVCVLIIVVIPPLVFFLLRHFIVLFFLFGGSEGPIPAGVFEDANLFDVLELFSELSVEELSTRARIIIVVKRLVRSPGSSTQIAPIHRRLLFIVFEL